ncbi:MULTISPECIES: heavy metal translocating P-type ATPase [Saprospirales]|jgi:Cu2+-exporting ATPase|uniref:heavy metal translocating P-type ATPase n=1 Tax=Saprospirales TaxID=1936988 RepID=UPI0008FBD424|nr:MULTISPECIES: heavy metal translocating P-type ATPase [Saprospirales]MCI5092717.1 heavy metal translocating P-type ATPase [Phaeodactylibacter sp.]
MKHTYSITGMTSAHCVRAVKKALEQIDGIASAEVILEPPHATITMHHHVAEKLMNEALAKAGDYRIKLSNGEEHSEHHHQMNQTGSAQQSAKMQDGHGQHQMEGEHGDHNPGHGEMGHDHHRMMIADFRKRFWASLILTVPILLLSPMIQRWLGLDWQFIGSRYLLFALSSIVYFYGGLPFLKGFLKEVRDKSLGMMTLIAMAISVAYFYSVATTFGLPGESFYWELATLIVIMLLGHWIEMKSVLGASKALELLVSMMPSEAHKIEGDQVVDISLEDLLSGDVILVKPGEKVPADGTVLEGESYLNESMLTGESKPVQKGLHDSVIGGSINGNGSLKVKVEHTGKDSYLNKVITMVQEAQKTKSKMQNLSDRAAKWLTYIALAVGFGTLVLWLALGKDFVFALERMVTVMVISCPHALGLAVPLVVAISTAISAQNGLLIRNRTAFEEARKISVLVFDKTGTLTKGDFGVTRYESLQNDLDQDEMLRLAGALERSSEHPIAVGIVQKIKELQITIPAPDNFEAITGKGVQASVEGKAVKVVSPGYLRDEKIEIPEGAYSSAAETVVFVIIDGALAGYIALADEIRPESAAAIKTFKANNIKVFMATGDNDVVGKAVSEELGLDGYYAEVLPHQKVEIVKELQAKGEFVAMTGDGVNDAPALAQADVGIAVGSGTDVAAETADIILVNSNPKDIANLILFGKATYSKMIQNLAWATGYNAIAIPLAVGILYPWGFVLSPAIGAVFMSLSTIIVAINAQLLKKKIGQ